MRFQICPEVEVRFLGAGLEMKSVRTRRHKYILSIGAEDVSKQGRHFIPERPMRRELFDLLEDPKERRNLLEAEGRDVEELTSVLDQELRAYASQPREAVGEVELEEDTIERLRELGYVE